MSGVCVSCVWLEVYLQEQVEITRKVGDHTQTRRPFSPTLNYIFGDSSPSFGHWHGLRRQPSRQLSADKDVGVGNVNPI